MESTMVLKIIVGLIIFLYALRGLRKGFIRTLMSMAFLIMAAALVYFANPAVSSFLKEKTPVYEVLQDKCEDIFSLKNLSRLQGGKEISNEKDTETEPTRIEQAKIIDSLALPELLKTQLAENNNASGYASLAVSGFEGYLAAFMTNLALRVLSYIITFILAVLILKLLVMTLDVVAELPLLKGINRTLGFLVGAAQGVCVVWILFLLITVLGGTDAGSRILILIGQDKVLSVFYDTNLFLKLLMGMFGNLFIA